MEWFVVGPDVLALLFLASVIAGFVDSIAGGGGLLSIPVLLAAGLSPAQVLATNKLQAVGGSFSASLYFIRRKAVDMKILKLAVPLTFVGAMFGAWLIQQIHADFLRKLLPVLVIGIGLYFLLMPKVGDEDRHARMSLLPFSLLGGACVGFYDGFFGPAPVRFMRWPMSHCWGSIWRKPPRTPKCSILPPISAACCSSCWAARWYGALVWSCWSGRLSAPGWGPEWC